MPKTKKPEGSQLSPEAFSAAEALEEATVVLEASRMGAYLTRVQSHEAYAGLVTEVFKDIQTAKADATAQP